MKPILALILLSALFINAFGSPVRDERNLQNQLGALQLLGQLEGLTGGLGLDQDQNEEDMTRKKRLLGLLGGGGGKGGLVTSLLGGLGLDQEQDLNRKKRLLGLLGGGGGGQGGLLSGLLGGLGLGL